MKTNYSFQKWIFYLFLFLWLPVSINLHGQDTLLLRYRDYLKRVKDYHPVIQQSNNLLDLAKANALMARGQFDPKLGGSYGSKSFNDKNYYQMWEGMVKVPTWYGVDLKGEYTRNNGDFLNEMDILPPRGLWSIGAEVPLGRGLIFDSRRAEVRRAEVFSRATEEERKLIRTDMLYEAAVAYLMWQENYQVLQFTNEYLKAAQIRTEGIRLSFINGDRPAIDTVEANLVVQTRTQEVLDARQNFENARIHLENFIWDSNFTPLELALNVVPEPIDVDFHRPMTDQVILLREETLANHPKIALLDLKIQDIEIENRVVREDMKPDLRVGYNILMGSRNNQNIFGAYNVGDHKIGATLDFPVLRRKQRGKLGINNFKIENITLDRSLNNQAISQKFSFYANNINLYSQQLVLVAVNTRDYFRLVEAENVRFAIGESSIFLVNLREVKYFESEIKLIETKSKVVKNRLGILFTTGDMFDRL